MATMHVELVSAEKRIWSGEANAVFARTMVGELGILPGHAPLLGALEPGWIVRIERQGEPDYRVAVDGGFLSVRKDGVSILAEVAEAAEDIDTASARDALQRAEREDTPDARAQRNWALSRLRAAGEAV
jgi:F-type H+-transporting ATPase subunit epsilon